MADEAGLVASFVLHVFSSACDHRFVLAVSLADGVIHRRGRFPSRRVKKKRGKSVAGPSTSSACMGVSASGQTRQEALEGRVLVLCEQMLLDTNRSKEKQQSLREEDTMVKREMVSCYLDPSSAILIMLEEDLPVEQKPTARIPGDGQVPAASLDREIVTRPSLLSQVPVA